VCPLSISVSLCLSLCVIIVVVAQASFIWFFFSSFGDDDGARFGAAYYLAPMAAWEIAQGLMATTCRGLEAAPSSARVDTTSTTTARKQHDDGEWWWCWSPMLRQKQKVYNIHFFI
jgi:hypothetical protein